jgi:hypothetical protein
VPRRVRQVIERLNSEGRATANLDGTVHKVVTPLFRAKPGDSRVDKQTGEIASLRHEPDAALHFEGDGEAAWGTKFVMVAARGTREGTRVILDIERVEKPGAEASVAMDCFRRLAPLVPGAQGILYDTALRGIHHQELLRDLGLLPINRVAAAEKGARMPRRKDGRRVAKNVYVEDKIVTGSDGRAISVSLYAQDGAIGIGRLTDRGQMVFELLRRIRTHRIRDKSGAYRWYNDYRLPQHLGGASSRYGCMRTTRTGPSASTEPRTSDRSRPAIPTSHDSTHAGTTRNPSTGTSRIPCSSEEPIAWAASASR